MEYPEFYTEPVYQEQTEAVPLMDLGVRRFEDILKSRLTPAVCVKPEDTVQNVIMAALEAGGIQLSNPEVIIEAAVNDPEVSAEITEIADQILSRDIQ